MNFNQIFYEREKCEVLLIQPHILKQVPLSDIDEVQTTYWRLMSSVGTLFGDLPIEPNWGLMYIAANCKANGIKVRMLDFHLYDYIKYQRNGKFISYDDIEAILRRKSFRVVGITAMTRSCMRAMRIAQICKMINPDCLVVLGGIHFSFSHDNKLLDSEFVDALILGEGEDAFIKFYQNADDKLAWGSINGLVYRQENKTVSNKNFNIIQNIDRLPYPDYESWPSDVPVIPRIYCSRGCIGRCEFCAVANFFCKTFRKRAIDNVLNEIEFLKSTYGFKEYLIGDLSFGIIKNDAFDLCHKLIEKKLNIHWWCQTRPDLIDNDLLASMKLAGCIQIGIGIESSSTMILNDTNAKKTTDRGIDKVLRRIKEADILVQGYFIIGLPGETMESANNTIDLISSLIEKELIDVAHISVLAPYPGTSLHDFPEQHGIEIVNWNYEDFLMNCDLMNSGVPVFNTSDLSRHQIYSLWQLALATAAKKFSNRTTKKTIMFEDLETFVGNIAFEENIEMI